MQKAIAKYGLAAHLAILAVAPLFLFPFFGSDTIAIVLLWLSFPAAVWMFLQPSVRRGEMLHDAQTRVSSVVFRDPLFWVMLTAVVFSGLRALNSGVAIEYDAEIAKWHMSSPVMPLMPASCGSAGFLPFAGSIGCMVLAIACRHALGRSARESFFLMSSALAGVAAVLAAFLSGMGNASAAAALRCPYHDLSFVGAAFAVYSVCGIVAVVSALENKWNRAVPVLILSVGGTAAGAFVFSPPYVFGMFSLAWIIVFAYSFFYALCVMRGASEFKMLLILAVSLATGCVLVAMTTVPSVTSSRVEAFLTRSFFPDWYAAARDAISAIAMKAWMSNPWTGTGVGSFGLDIRFNGTQADWSVIPRELVAPPLGWLKLLTERGIAGAAMMALPLILMLVSFFARLVGWIFVRTAPRPGCWVAPAVLLAVVAVGFFDCSYLRVDVLMAVAAILALSASAFPKARKGESNG